MGKQRQHHASCRAACTQKQDAFAAQFNAQVFAQITHQAFAVGVVAQNAAVLLRHEGIDRACGLGALAVGVGKIVGKMFERQGDVGTGAALLQEGAGGVVEIGARVINQSARVFNLHAFLSGEILVDLRRFAVCDGIAEHGVAWNHARFLCVSIRFYCSGVYGKSQTGCRLLFRRIQRFFASQS